VRGLFWAARTDRPARGTGHSTDASRRFGISGELRVARIDRQDIRRARIHLVKQRTPPHATRLLLNRRRCYRRSSASTNVATASCRAGRERRQGRPATSRCPSPWAGAGPVAATVVTHVPAQWTRTTVAAPSVATSRSPGSAVAAESAVALRRKMLSVPGWGL